MKGGVTQGKGSITRVTQGSPWLIFDDTGQLLETLQEITRSPSSYPWDKTKESHVEPRLGYGPHHCRNV